MEGHILKWSNYLTGWQKRYFVLVNNELTYFESENAYKNNNNDDSNFRGAISISRNSTEIEIKGLYTTISNLNGKESLYLQFLNETDKRNWLVKIGTSRACQQAVNFPEVLVAKANKQSKEIEKTEPSIAIANTEKDITHESDHFQSIQENYTNHKELLINEIKIIQETLTNFTSNLEKSETTCAELDKLELKNDETEIELVKNKLEELKSSENKCGVDLKNVTEKLCKVQLLSTEYFDLVEQITGQIKIQDFIKKQQTRLETQTENLQTSETNKSISSENQIEQNSLSEVDKSSSVQDNNSDHKIVQQAVIVEKKNSKESLDQERSKKSENSEKSEMSSISFWNSRPHHFGNLTPNSANEVDVESFLKACEEFSAVYDLIGGSTFAPLKSDVMGNVNKIRGKAKEYNNLQTIEQIVQFEIDNKTTTKKGSATDACMWLRRGLWLFCKFLLNVVNGEADAKVAFSSAYDQTLSKHHNFIVRKVVNVMLVAFPSWESLMPVFLTKHDEAEGTMKEVLMKHIREYVDNMQPSLEKLDEFYVGNKLSL